jgi:hypothetical protein
VIRLTNLKENNSSVNLSLWDPSKESCVYSSYLDIRTYASKKFIENSPEKPPCTKECY